MRGSLSPGFQLVAIGSFSDVSPQLHSGVISETRPRVLTVFSEWFSGPVYQELLVTYLQAG